MNSHRYLVDKFEATKREIGQVESTIRRLTGRDPDEIMAAGSRSGRRLSSSAKVPSTSTFSNRKNSYTKRKHSRGRESSSASESTSDEESPMKKPALQSTVVAKGHQKRSRKATIEEQNANSKIKDRNRRIFGAIVATLQKFQSEEKKRQEKETCRAEIEQRVEAATEVERERIKQEKEHLFHVRREKKAELRCLEKKIERAECHETYDKNHNYLLNFIMTKSKPSIFFLPSTHTSKTRKALEASQSKLKETIRKRKESFENDISEIEEWYKKDYPKPGDKENKQPEEESESSQDSVKIIPHADSVIVEQEDLSHDSKDVSHDHRRNSNSNSDTDDEDSNASKNDDSAEVKDFQPIYD